MIAVLRRFAASVKIDPMPTTLTDNVVLLRPLQPTDRDAMYAAVMESIAEVSPWLPWCHPAYASGETAAFIESSMQAWANQSHFTFGIFDAADGSCCGTISLNHIVRQNRYANIGYWVRTGRTRRGLASRAVRLVARFAFENVGLTRVEIAAIPENLASRRVAEKAGATLESVIRNRIVMHGRAYPAALYSLVPQDLASVSAQPS
jgi:ribosomal-protein-serine acetyltransferase